MKGRERGGVRTEEGEEHTSGLGKRHRNGNENDGGMFRHHAIGEEWVNAGISET